MRWISLILILVAFRPANAVTELDSTAAQKLYSAFLIASNKMSWADRPTNYFAERLSQQASEADPNLQRYLEATTTVPSTHPMVVDLVERLTASAHSDSEKLFLIHNFVVWRMTHTAFFFKPLATKISMASRKGRLYQCIHHAGEGNAWIKPPEVCGLFEDIDVGDDHTLSLFFTGLHNCWGYSVLFATLARAAGIPTQIAKFTQSNSQHVWNRVYLGGAWYVVDTTFDDGPDRGQYEDDSAMKVEFDYFLITDKMAAKLDPETHARYRVTDD